MTPIFHFSVFVPRSETGGLHEIRWLYPIHGYPELPAPADEPPAMLRCQARTRVEERLEVTLAGVAPSASGAKRGATTRAMTPAGQTPNLPEGVVLGESEYQYCTSNSVSCSQLI